MEEKKSLKERCKEGWNRHKKKVIIAGGVVVGLAGGYYLVHNWDGLFEQVSRLVERQSLQEVVEVIADEVPSVTSEPVIEIVNATREVMVNPHIMRLPVGKQASEAAKAFAEECGFVLAEGQTARHGCTRNIAA